MAERRDNSGVAYANTKRSDKTPDYSGPCLIDGVEKRVSIWFNRNDRGEYLSLRFAEPQPRDEQRPAPRAQPAPAERPAAVAAANPAQGDAFDDDIPF